MPSDPDSHAARIRERFTRTAEQFARFSLAERSAEANQLLALSLPHLSAPEKARYLDVACGPGTFTLVFAPRMGRTAGLDFTPALLAQACAAASRASAILSLVCGDATALPYPACCFELATCAYGLHHFAQPPLALREMSRVLAPGGVLALVDIVVPDNAAQAAAANAIERARDSSHTRTLPATEIRELLTAAGFTRLASEPGERPRSFDDWMQIAGHRRGDPAYVATRRLMEAAIPGDAAGFRARLSAAHSPDSIPDIEWVQTSFFFVARCGIR